MLPSEPTSQCLADGLRCLVTPREPEAHGDSEIHIVFAIDSKRPLMNEDVDTLEKSGAFGEQNNVYSLGWSSQTDARDDGMFRSNVRKIWQKTS